MSEQYKALIYKTKPLYENCLKELNHMFTFSVVVIVIVTVIITFIIIVVFLILF